jgi:triacylglycerol esterase/lipase EstA (alpha/beta hydrolase family)
MRTLSRSRRPLALLAVLACLAGPVSAGTDTLPAALVDALRPLEPFVTTGVLYDRVLPLAHLESLDGTAAAPVVDGARWRQACHELRRAALALPPGPDLAALEAGARAARRAGVVPLALLDRAFERVRPEALADGSLELVDGRLVGGPVSPLVRSRAVALAALAPRTYRGGDVVFALDAERCVCDGGWPRELALDFDDGRGLRPVRPGERVRVRYATTGPRTLTARLVRDDGSVAEARCAFEVAALATPGPDDTLHVTATVPFEGSYGSGDAYVYLAPGRTQLVNPVLVVEGFDLDNSMGWDELYALLNQQDLIETLRADGFDAVVLDFTDATVPVEENGLLVAALIQHLQDQLAPTTTLALIGASMGGLCSRYALAWLESQGLPHRVRTWISFDGPQSGADIPLGLQYWIRFFAGQSASAAEFLATLERPAARQLLLYHFTVPAGSTGQPDPLRDSLQAHLAALGDWPTQPRRVAVANGSGAGQDQGFAPGAQLIRYEYSSLLVALTGNVWALPDQVSGTIFQGSLRILLSTTSQTVTVSGTLPWDGAPGGLRASMTQLDTTAAPYGDIVALHPSHDFIPTISALALDTADPFFDVDGAADLLALTPFDAVYYPAVNEEHVAITPVSAVWLRAEIEQGVVAVPGGVVAARPDLRAAPNPCAGPARLSFTLVEPGPVRLDLYDLGGRTVRALAHDTHAAGRHVVTWDGRDGQGTPVAPGVYFARLDAGGATVTRRLVRLDGPVAR